MSGGSWATLISESDWLPGYLKCDQYKNCAIDHPFLIQAFNTKSEKVADFPRPSLKSLANPGNNQLTLLCVAANRSTKPVLNLTDIPSLSFNDYAFFNQLIVTFYFILSF